jgi:hypothetical protein
VAAPLALLAAACTSTDSAEPSGSPATGPTTTTTGAASPSMLRQELPVVFSPIIGRVVGDETAPVLGSDGRLHVVYEVQLTNARTVPATISKLEVLDFDQQDRQLASYTGDELVVAQLSVRPREAQVLEPDPDPLQADNPELVANESMLAFIELTFDDASQVPKRLVHRITGTGATNPGSTAPAPIDYLMAPWDISARTTPVIAPPLAGTGWTALNGCCSTAGAHRSSVQTVSGDLVGAQRFAIDWIKIGDDGAFFNGDPTDVNSWYNYDLPVLAVADATVVEVLDELPDQPVGTLPDPETMTIETVDGNHVILDLGGGVYAFYAHLRQGSINVKVGDTVTTGQELGRLGNSGNTSAPHLHFHLMAGPSALGADGMPMAFDQYRFTGAIDPAQWAEATESLDDTWRLVDTAETGERTGELPLDLVVVEFRSP